MSWNYFAEGIDKEGKPEAIGDIVGDNFMHIVSVRKLRYSLATSLLGEVYGLTGGIAFTMFLILEIMLTNIFAGTDIPPGMTSILSLGSVMDINFLALLLMAMMVGQS
jgi:archaellum biogenesis protein FlaJ (TadC family)